MMASATINIKTANDKSHLTSKNVKGTTTENIENAVNLFTNTIWKMDSQQVLVEEQKWEWQAFLKVNFIC
jgi:hypothetical protein